MLQHGLKITFNDILLIVFLSLNHDGFGISLAASTAYAFARFTFPLKELLFKMFIFTLIIPSLLNIIPQFTIIKALGLVDTHAGLILLYVGSGVVGVRFSCAASSKESLLSSRNRS